jgi:alpha-L-glutamate ligase-like protein
MNWLRRFRQLREMGVLGMNQRNADFIQALNPRHRFPVVDSKRRMDDLCHQIGVPTPTLYGVIESQSTLRHLPGMLAPLNDFVIKPNRGAGGRGILVVSGRDGAGFSPHNGEHLTMTDLRHHLSDILCGLFSLGGQADSALIQQRVLLHPAFERISFQGIGDVRVILYKHVPVMAMLRLPTRESGGRANLHQGGIGAGVDLDSGLTRHAVIRNRVATQHPDTKASVVGFRVPYWREILNMSVRVSRAVGLGYIGVDVVVDRRQGPLLLEANARPGLAIQIANGQGLIPRLQQVDYQMARDEARDLSIGADPSLVPAA